MSLDRSLLARSGASSRARCMAILDAGNIDPVHRDRAALLIALASERPQNIGRIFEVIWPDAKTTAANKAMVRLAERMRRAGMFVRIEGAKSAGPLRTVHVFPMPSAWEMGC